jgi:hypothetical protein
MIALRFCWVRKRWASFLFSFLNYGLHGPHGFLPTREGQGVGCEMVTALFNILRKLSECSERFRAAF